MQPILIADDKQSDVVLLERLLRREHVMNPIRSVQDGEQAIAYFNGDGVYGNRDRYPFPSIFFLDLKMPKCGGFEVLEFLRERGDFQNVLTIVLSNLDDTQDINRAYQMGAKSYLIKPTNPDELRNLIEFFQGYWEIAPGAVTYPTTAVTEGPAKGL